MDKHNILENVKKIHELSGRCVEYENAQKKCTGKYCEISKWIDETIDEIKAIKSKIIDQYKELFKNDICGKYLIMTRENESENSVFFFHTNDVAKQWKSIYFRYDLLLVPLGEYLSLTFDKNGNLLRSKYIKQTDEFDPYGSGYLTSNHYYRLIHESFNGWKETTKEVFDSFIKKYVPIINDNVNLDEIYSNAEEIKINGED